MPLGLRWPRVSHLLCHGSLFAHLNVCICSVAGEIDTIEILQDRNIHDVIEGIKVQAVEKAIKGGADPGKGITAANHETLLIAHRSDC